jgi:aquaporin Z
MLSATAFATLFQHPASPLSAWLPMTAAGRLPMGIAMGLTAVALIYSPIGRRSGAHMNPAVTLTFWRLGKLGAGDAIAYVIAQCVGGVMGSAVATLVLGGLPAHASVNFIVTTPEAGGAGIAFVAEAAISFVMMLTVLVMSNHPRIAAWTGLAAGTLVALFIVFEAPISGMSMNPARTLAPDLLSGSFRGFWIYSTAPCLGMLAAAELFVGRRGLTGVRCAKLHHAADVRCIFHCRHAARLSPPSLDATVGKGALA